MSEFHLFMLIIKYILIIYYYYFPIFSSYSDFSENEIMINFSWSNGLQLARVTHWGGMISTPDIRLQNTIKDALIQSGCSVHIANQLMENVHERHWPEGLSTLGSL